VWAVNATSVLLLFASAMIFLAVQAGNPMEALAHPPPSAAAHVAPWSGSGDRVISSTAPGASEGLPLGVQLPTGARRSGPPAAPPSVLAADGIPATALAAYENAARWESGIDPGCGITWPLLAGIGRVESDHGRFAGAVLYTDGTSVPEIIGIALDGNGTALIRDTDGGRLDGDPVYDHAVGPMQFIPSTWATYGVDVLGTGTADPFNIFDAAAAAARYLCAASDVTTFAGQQRAVFAYNHSADYVRTVLAIARTYAAGVPGVTFPVPSDPSPAAGSSRPTHERTASPSPAPDPSRPPVDRPGADPAPCLRRAPPTAARRRRAHSRRVPFRRRAWAAAAARAVPRAAARIRPPRRRRLPVRRPRADRATAHGDPWKADTTPATSRG
jgi:hypothetical protein